ncbi:MAG TPA: sigma 54-interacting transcriptional regulator [Blastocatellia bacterium]|jgi:FADH2 O2-dependent halogenase|nr:sigma 54-interacting transcriptional regulator [Blastocatellia bacterium]
MRSDFDLAIIGSGFSGSLLAMIAGRVGRSVMLLDRGVHPRFAIGESTSPLLNLVIEQVADRYDLPRLKPLTSWGEWQRTYPQVVGGLKRGSTYFKHESGARYLTAPDRSNQLLVSTCLNDEAADTHWLRSDVDYFLLREAIASGADFLDQTELHSIELANGGGATLWGGRRGRALKLRARLVVDASGPRGFLSRALGLGEKRFDDFPATQALYSHFIGVHRCDSMPDYEVAGATPHTPFPMDDAAVHHVFDGGWMWALRFNNGVTSAGIVVTEETAKELELSEGEAAWRRFLARFPSIAAQFADAKAIREFTWAPHLPYAAEAAAGEGWAMLPAAAAFVDPLFGPGMPMTALGVERLGRLLEEDLGEDELNERLREYGRITLTEADHTADFIAGCYTAFPRFELFTSLSMVYFAAAGYCEMARRLGRNHLAQSFLAADHPTFAEGASRLSQTLRRNDRFDSANFAAQVKQKIDCLNVAGLCDRRKRNWYDVDLDDVIAGAEKLEITSDEMRRFLLTSNWAQTAVNLRRRSLNQPHQSIPTGPSGRPNRTDVYLNRLTDEYDPVGELVGASPAYKRMLEDASNVAPTDTTVLLQGETGTGKELLAYAIHQRSLRNRGPFIVVNCAALPASLIESELFGYEKGAFTGAQTPKPGRFELADGGTIFLDEIGEVPLEIQGRFLRVLQTGVFERLGSTKSVRVKIRVIAATNQPLERLVNERKFRADLFYRLNVFPITLPPLRDRLSDLPLLTRHFVEKYNTRFNRSITSISEQSLRALEQYHWPGNIRELENLVERAVLSAGGAILKIVPPSIRVEPAISINDKPPETATAMPDNGARRLLSLTENEEAHIRTVLRHTGGRISGPRGAAAILGVPPSTLRSRIKKLGLKIHLAD